MVDVVLRTEYGRSSSPKIRFIKLLFPEPVSPAKMTRYQYIRSDCSHLEGLQKTIELGSSLKGGRKRILGTRLRKLGTKLQGATYYGMMWDIASKLERGLAVY